MQNLAYALGVAAIGAVFFSIVEKEPFPDQYLTAFAVTLKSNLSLLVIASIGASFLGRRKKAVRSY